MDDIDLCPNTPIEQAIFVRTNGCSEAESDDDGDGVFTPVDGPNGMFKNDPTQSADSDGDGYGDNVNGTDGDACAQRFGNSTQDRLGCTDTDGDGYSDPESGWSASDGADAWKNEKTQWSDYDGDGYFDNYNDPAWTATREEGWPGIWISDARIGDKCPMNASDSAYPDPGCPEKESVILDYGNSNSGSSGLPTMLIVIIILIIGGLGALTVAVVMKQKKPQKSRSKSRKAVKVDPAQTHDDDWVEPEVEEETNIEDDPNYKVDEDGCEWWFDEGVWWYRQPEMDDWVQHEG
jgi:hypothetical protein